MDSADQQVPAFYVQYNAQKNRVYERERERERGVSYYIDQVKDDKMSGGCRTRGRKDIFVNTSITHVKPT